MQQQWSSIGVWLETLWQHFSLPELLLLGLNVVLLFAAPLFIRRLPALRRLGDDSDTPVRIFRFLNLLSIMLLVGANIVFPEAGRTPLLKWVSVLLVIYLAYLSFHLLSWFIRLRFGKFRQVGEESHMVDTYNSRMLVILAAVLATVITILACVQMLEFDSLLQAGGVLGFLGVMLALTQAAWAPDLISGVIVLNSRLVEEGDVIQLEPNRLVAMVFKTRMFHTEVINMANDHRIMIRNSALRDREIHNLSKFASPRGLRECLVFNIGYDVSTKSVEALFAAVWTRAQSELSQCIESKHPPQLRLLETGDHALQWGWFYYTRSVKQVLSTRQALRQMVLQEALARGISLATPTTLSLSAASAWPSDKGVANTL